MTFPTFALTAQFAGGDQEIGDTVRSGFSMQLGSLQPSLTGMVADSGQLQTTVENFDRAFDPSIVADVAPGVGLKLVGTWDSTDYALFLGRTEGWPQNTANRGRDQFVSLTAMDAVSQIAQAKLRTGAFPRQTTGARIQAVLTAIGWTGGTSIDPGTALVPRIRADGSPGNPWALIADAVACEWGYGFIDGTGAVVFNDRNGVAAGGATPLGIFGDNPIGDPTELPFEEPDTPYDKSRTVNDADNSYNQHGDIAHAEDLTSQGEDWGPLTWQQNIPDASGPHARSYVTHLVHQQATPTLRVASLKIKPQDQPADLWPIVLGLQPGQPFTVKRTPLGGGARIEVLVFVRGYSHELVDGEWTTVVYFDDSNLVSVHNHFDGSILFDGSATFDF